jgi:hypothetical protein
VVLAMQSDPGTEHAEGVSQHVSVSFEQMGVKVASQMLAATSCELVATAPFPAGATNVGLMKDATARTVDDLCGSACSYVPAEFPLAQTATTLGPLAVTKVVADPSINFVQATFSSAGPLIEAALIQAGIDTDIVGSGGNKADLESIANGGLMKANVIYAPGEFTGWAVVDGITRVLLGESPDDLEIPTRLITEEGVAGGIESADLWEGFDKFPAAFKSNWGLK